EHVVFWSDSKITVDRLNKPINKLDTKVVNRVWSIKQATKAEYKWLSGKTNVADHLTRGYRMKALLELNEWWNAPTEVNEYRYVAPIAVSLNVIQVKQIE